MTQGFCPDISSCLLISSLAALYGLSHHGLAVLLLPASPCRVPQKPRSSPDRSTAEQQVMHVCVSELIIQDAALNLSYFTFQVSSFRVVTFIHMYSWV